MLTLLQSAQSLAGEAAAYLDELRSRLTTLQRTCEASYDEVEATLDEAARWVGKGAARYMMPDAVIEAFAGEVSVLL